MHAISFYIDALVVKFNVTKSDQTGEKTTDKHVYANPLKPEICPFLALAVLLVCRGRQDGDFRLFPHDGVGQFGNVLHSVLADNALVPDDTPLGPAHKKDIGTHSERKGVLTYLCSLCHCISAIAIYLRAGWSLGNVQDRYLFAGSGSDQLVGRAIACLPITSTDFAVLPPHFVPEDLAVLKRIGINNLIHGYDEFPACFQHAVVYLLASLIYHIDFLERKLSRQHPLWSQRIFTTSITVAGTRYANAIELFRNKMITGTMSCRQTDMIATGIPDHILTSCRLATLEAQVGACKAELAAQFDARCDKMEQDMALLPEKIRQTLLENFTIDGVAPINMADIRGLLTTEFSRIEDMMRELRAPPAIPEAPAAAPAQGHIDPEGAYTLFHWAGKYRMVPETWVFPKQLGLRPMFHLWHYGNSGLSIRPYKILHKFHDDLRTKDEKERYSRTKKVMTALDEIIAAKSYLPQGRTMDQLSEEEEGQVLNKAYNELLSIVEGAAGSKTRRAEDVAVDTLANKYQPKKHKARYHDAVAGGAVAGGAVAGGAVAGGAVAGGAVAGGAVAGGAVAGGAVAGGAVAGGRGRGRGGRVCCNSNCTDRSDVSTSAHFCSVSNKRVHAFCHAAGGPEGQGSTWPCETCG